MNRPFFIAGPTGVGKSDLAVEVAAAVKAEIVSGDAFQIYRELPILSAQPEPALLAKVPHHLVAEVSVREEMNAERFRTLAKERIDEIFARSRRVIVVGGSGLYLKALTHGLASLPETDPALRRDLNEMSPAEMVARLQELAPAAAQRIDLKNPRRVMRALEICLLGGTPVSAQSSQWKSNEEPSVQPTGVLLERDRDELKERINRRVKDMFDAGVVSEVERLPDEISTTATQAIGLKQIRSYLANEISCEACVAQIQSATRQYAKRQLTWFRHQGSFESLNLSSIGHADVVHRLVERVFSLS